MKKFKLTSFLLGVCVTLLLSSLVMTTFAAGPSKTINVSSGVSLYMDDKQVVPKDANGNTVEVFIYNGTTYVPVRAVSQLFDTPIQWDGKKSSVYIGKHSSTTPAAYLEELEPFTGKNLKCTSYEDDIIDNLGTRRNHVLYGNFDNVYYINGNYTSLTGTLYQPKKYNNSDFVKYLTIYGDDRLLYEASMVRGVFPIDFNIDLSGVLKLRIVMSGSEYSKGCLSEVALWT